jgi:hypothetical protein
MLHPQPQQQPQIPLVVPCPCPLCVRRQSWARRAAAWLRHVAAFTAAVVAGAIRWPWVAAMCIRLRTIREGDVLAFARASYTVLLRELRSPGLLLLRRVDEHFPDERFVRVTHCADGAGVLAAASMDCDADALPFFRVLRGVEGPRGRLVGTLRSLLRRAQWTRTVCFSADRTVMTETRDPGALARVLFQLERPARVIQRAWRLVAADPGCAVCARRLLREASELRI